VPGTRRTGSLVSLEDAGVDPMLPVGPGKLRVPLSSSGSMVADSKGADAIVEGVLGVLGVVYEQDRVDRVG
jgi:hypothetical protein